MRVIAGEKGGRRLLAPPGHGTRPTSDRVREAAFSMLDSLGVLDGARVWDLFAGSGAMGIEALSRGAAHATFVEQAKGRGFGHSGEPGRVGLREQPSDRRLCETCSRGSPRRLTEAVDGQPGRGRRRLWRYHEGPCCLGRYHEGPRPPLMS